MAYKLLMLKALEYVIIKESFYFSSNKYILSIRVTFINLELIKTSISK